ncbi:MAG: HD domain-containing protein [Paludibacter sp.]
MLEPYKIIEKYYPKDTDIYFILTIHSEQVCEKALQIADKHPDLKLDKQFLYEASMLHDIGIFKCDAPRIHCRGTHQYIEHGYLGAEILRAEGLPQHALVCERHTGTGLTKETILINKLNIPAQDYFPLSLEEQVICYADKYYSKSKLAQTHSVEQIRNELSRFGSNQVAMFDTWRSLFD